MGWVEPQDKPSPRILAPPGARVAQRPDYTASARATRPSKVISFPSPVLAALLEDDHLAAVLMKKLADLISRRLRDTQVQLLSLTARQHA